MSPKILPLAKCEFQILRDEVVSEYVDRFLVVCLYSETAGAGSIARFAKGAVARLSEEIRTQTKSDRASLKAKIAGSADEKTLEACRRDLRDLEIPLAGESIGAGEKRQIFFYPATGRLRIDRGTPVAAIDAKKTEPPAAGIAARKKTKKKVFIVDDSKSIREILRKILTSDDLEIVGTAANPVEAEPLIEKTRPDVLTLDIHMPLMDGVTFLRRLLPRHPLPVVMVTSAGAEEGGLVMQALEDGAVDYIPKPTLSDLPALQESIREKVLAAASIRVFKKKKSETTLLRPMTFDTRSVIAIGSSTGGVEALKEVLTHLPEGLPPILIVQHIPAAFSAALATRLNSLCSFEVREAVNGDQLRPGLALLAPGGMQMRLRKTVQGLAVKIYDGEKVNRHKPSVDVLFDSVAEVCGASSLGVILTGMGDDGADGLLKMRKKGALTLAQDEESSTVYGMPKAAFERGAAYEVVALEKMAEAILRNINDLGKNRRAG